MRPVHNPLRATLRPVQPGFTLIEVMIAAAMGMVLLFATLSLFDNTHSARARLSRTNEVFQTGVFAMATLQGDIKLAGFFGEGALPTALPSTMPSACSTTAADWLATIPVPMQAYLAGSSGMPSCVPGSLVANSSVLVVRRAATCTVGSSNCSTGSSGTPMVQISQCSTDTSKAQTGTTTSSLTLKALNCTSSAPIRQYYTRIYYLDQHNVSGDGIPTLKRLDLGSSGFSTVTIAQGVQQMRLVYGVDSSGSDGVADSWTSAPASSDWHNIVETKISLLMKGSQSENGYSNNRAYKVGDLDVAAANDSYHRTLLSAVVRSPNIAGPRE